MVKKSQLLLVILSICLLQCQAKKHHHGRGPRAETYEQESDDQDAHDGVGFGSLLNGAKELGGKLEKVVESAETAVLKQVDELENSGKHSKSKTRTNRRDNPDDIESEDDEDDDYGAEGFVDKPDTTKLRIKRKITKNSGGLADPSLIKGVSTLTEFMSHDEGSGDFENERYEQEEYDEDAKDDGSTSSTKHEPFKWGNPFGNLASVRKALNLGPVSRFWIGAAVILAMVVTVYIVNRMKPSSGILYAQFDTERVNLSSRGGSMSMGGAGGGEGARDFPADTCNDLQKAWFNSTASAMRLRPSPANNNNPYTNAFNTGTHQYTALPPLVSIGDNGVPTIDFTTCRN